MTQTQPASDFAILQGHQFMNLITFRKNGQPVTTPVWFAQEGQKLYVFTGAASGKIKRIRNSGAVQVGPSDRAGKPLGPVASGQAHVVSGGEATHADELITAKYGWQKKLIGFFNTFRKNTGGAAFIEITPSGA